MFLEVDILGELERLNLNKETNPNCINPRVLKELHFVIAAPLTDLFNQSLLTGDVPGERQMFPSTRRVLGKGPVTIVQLA